MRQVLDITAEYVRKLHRLVTGFAIRLAARIPADERSVNMQQLMVQVPTIVQAYLRWMTGDMRVNTQFDPLNPATPVFDVSLNLAEGCLNLMAAVDSGGLKYDLPAGLYDIEVISGQSGASSHNGSVNPHY